MYWMTSTRFDADSNTLLPWFPPIRRDRYASVSASTVCFLCSFRTLSTAFIFFRSLSVMVPARTAPSQGIGRARMLFCSELRYVGGSRDIFSCSRVSEVRVQLERSLDWLLYRSWPDGAATVLLPNVSKLIRNLDPCSWRYNFLSSLGYFLSLTLNYSYFTFWDTLFDRSVKDRSTLLVYQYCVRIPYLAKLSPWESKMRTKSNSSKVYFRIQRSIT